MQRADGGSGARAVLLGLVLALEVVIFGLETDRFVSLTNFAEIVRRATELALPAFAVTALLVRGTVDLSLGGIMALAAAVFAATTRPGGLPLAAGAALALVVGALGGALNAVAVARLKLSPLLVTLGTGWIFRGAARVITRANARSGFPAAWLALGQKYLLAETIPAQLLLLLAAMALYWWLLRRARPLALLYSLGGLVTAAAALAQVARTGDSAIATSNALEALTLAAAVIGGASLAGGHGGVAGTLLAVLVIVAAMNALTLAAVPVDVAGVLVALAALGSGWAARRQGCRSQVKTGHES